MSAAVLILVSIPVYGQEQDNSVPAAVTGGISEDTIILGDSPFPESGAGDSSVWIVIRMVLVLALAALAIYGVVFFIKRLARPPQAKDPNLKLLASIPLAGDTFAAVISVGAKAWLVGGGSGAGISLISEITDPEALETMLIDDARKNADNGLNRFLDFRSLLNRFGKRPGPDTSSKNDFEAQILALRKQQERLERLRS